ncbi:MAG: hypothetical protein OXC69_08585 [Candidatus Tectomicrobia bacterium]|nr:hypothetical protein [Candidatus Tectomicrobia bacterium]
MKGRWFAFNTLVVLILGLLTAASAGQAQDNVLEREDIETTYSELNKIIVDIEGAITAAENALENVKTMEIEDGRTATDELFGKLKGKVNGMLEGLAPNSVLIDNLEGAKANVIVLKRWFERQPPDYPNRDHLIMRVDTTVQNYEELSEQILTGRQEAQDALRQLLRAQFYQSMELKVESAELSVEVTKRLVMSLQKLSTKIRQLAEQEVPQTIPN